MASSPYHPTPRANLNDGKIFIAAPGEAPGMEIIPVVDIRGGRAVAGKGGRREEYRDLETVFYPSPDPLEIARRMPYERLYVADLDGVVQGKPDIPLLEELAGVKKLMVDAGIRTPEDLERVS